MSTVTFCETKGCNKDAVSGPYCDEHSNPRNRLFKLHTTTCTEALALMRAKNEDYAIADDPYRNFRTFGRIGILVRMSDKLARLRTFEERGTLSVPDESVGDTVRDIINYAILYLGYK